VFVHLAAELRTGDTAVDGAGEYADWNAQLLPWEDYAGKLPGYLAEVGLAGNLEQAQRYDGTVFRGQLLDMLKNTAASADAGYPANEDLQIDPETGVPSLNVRLIVPRPVRPVAGQPDRHRDHVLAHVDRRAPLIQHLHACLLPAEGRYLRARRPRSPVMN